MFNACMAKLAPQSKQPIYIMYCLLLDSPRKVR